MRRSTGTGIKTFSERYGARRVLLPALVVAVGVALNEVGQGFARPMLSELSTWQDVATLVCQALVLVLAAIVSSKGVLTNASDPTASATCQVRAACRVAAVVSLTAAILSQIVIFVTFERGGLTTAYMGSGLCGVCFGACSLAWVLVVMDVLAPKEGVLAFIAGLAFGRLASMFIRVFGPIDIWIPIGFACLDAGIAVLVMTTVLLMGPGRSETPRGRRVAAADAGILDGIHVPRTLPSWRASSPVFLGAGMFSLLFGFMTQVHNASRGFTTLPDYVSALVTIVALLALAARVAFGTRPLDVGRLFLLGIPVLAGILVLAPLLWESFSDVADALVKSAFNLCYAAVVAYLLQNAQPTCSRPTFAAVLLAALWTCVAIGSGAGAALAMATGLDSPTITAFALGGIWLGMVASTALARIGGVASTEEAVALAVAQAREEERAMRPEAEVIYVDRTEEQVRRFSEEFGLTDREREIVLLFVRGRSAARIAEDLTLSEHTVKTHLQNAYAKAGLHNRQELLDRVGSVEV